MIYDNVPSVVQETFGNHDVWWKHGQRSTLELFLCHYNLKKSYSLGILFQQHGSSQLIIKLDALNINPEGKNPDLPIASQYIGALYLSINFTSVHQILSDHAEKYVEDNQIIRASTKIVSPQERAVWLELFSKLDVVNKDSSGFLADQNVHCTTLEGSNENHIHVIHSEPTLFLCLKYDGSILKLPDLDLPEKSDEDETMASK